MMLWMDPHRRTRRRLSAYIDRQLTARDVRAVEAHLAVCDECRTEAAELRATVQALRALPPLEPPRSFALTPAMVRAPERLAPPALAPVQTGMRLAAAGLAVALAVVFVADAGNVGQDSGSGPRAAFDSAEMYEALTMQTAAPAGDIDSAGGAGTAQGGDAGPTGAPGADTGVASGDDLDSSEPPAVSAPGTTAAPAPSEAPKANVQELEEGGNDAAVEDEARLALTGPDGGQDTLRTVEIALAAALALAVAASAVLAVAGRRR